MEGLLEGSCWEVVGCRRCGEGRVFVVIMTSKFSVFKAPGEGNEVGEFPRQRRWSEQMGVSDRTFTNGMPMRDNKC